MGTISVNGKVQEMDVPVILIDLMAANQVVRPEMVSVQVNGEFVSREIFGSLQVNNGDEVDFLYFMGGGSRC